MTRLYSESQKLEAKSMQEFGLQKLLVTGNLLRTQKILVKTEFLGRSWIKCQSILLLGVKECLCSVFLFIKHLSIFCEASASPVFPLLWACLGHAWVQRVLCVSMIFRTLKYSSEEQKLAKCEREKFFPILTAFILSFSLLSSVSVWQDVPALMWQSFPEDQIKYLKLLSQFQAQLRPPIRAKRWQGCLITAHLWSQSLLQEWAVLWRVGI